VEEILAAVKRVALEVDEVVQEAVELDGKSSKGFLTTP